jgi:hypothetical protein
VSLNLTCSELLHENDIVPKSNQTIYSVRTQQHTQSPVSQNRSVFRSHPRPSSGLHFNIKRYYLCTPGSSVGIATGYGLEGSGIESRWEARFSAPVQTGPEAHPASCIMGTGSFPGVEGGRGVTLTPHPPLVPRSKNRVELFLYSP